MRPVAWWRSTKAIWHTPLLASTNPSITGNFALAKVAIERVSSEKQTLEDQLTDAKLAADDLEYRLELLFKSVTPFLDNLCKNSEKSTIYWPDRVAKIEAYKSKLKSIVEGS